MKISNEQLEQMGGAMGSLGKGEPTSQTMNKDMPDNIYAGYEMEDGCRSFWLSPFDPTPATKTATEYLRRTVSREDARAALEWMGSREDFADSEKRATIRKLLEQAGK